MNNNSQLIFTCLWVAWGVAYFPAHPDNGLEWVVDWGGIPGTK